MKEDVGCYVFSNEDKRRLDNTCVMLLLLDCVVYFLAFCLFCSVFQGSYWGYYLIPLGFISMFGVLLFYLVLCSRLLDWH